MINFPPVCTSVICLHCVKSKTRKEERCFKTACIQMIRNVRKFLSRPRENIYFWVEGLMFEVTFPEALVFLGSNHEPLSNSKMKVFQKR